MIERDLFSWSIFLFIIGIIVIFVAGLIGITTPFLAFSYFVLTIGLFLIAIAEIGIFLTIVISSLNKLRIIMKKGD